MWALLKENLRYIIRAKLIFMLLAFSFVIHYVGLKLINHLTVSFQNQISIIGGKEALFVCLFLQLFTGIFLVAVYGIWMAPYAHRGDRGVLTFVLPVSKWAFPVCYALCCLGLLLLNQAVMFGSYGAVFGWNVYSGPDFPWRGVLSTLSLEVLALEVLMLWLSVSSLSFGQVPTFFLGAMGMFVLQVLGGLARMSGDVAEQPLMSTWRVILLVYRKLPPIGELVFDIKELFLRGVFHWDHVALWIVWLVLSVVIFRFKLRYPLKTRSTES